MRESGFYLYKLYKKGELLWKRKETWLKAFLFNCGGQCHLRYSFLGWLAYYTLRCGRVSRTPITLLLAFQLAWAFSLINQPMPWLPFLFLFYTSAALPIASVFLPELTAQPGWGHGPYVFWLWFFASPGFGGFTFGDSLDLG